MSTSTLESPETTVRTQRPHNVVLLNDDDHTVDYVVRMCSKVFGTDTARGIEIAQEVHFTGRCIVYSGSLEVAELKQEQVHSFGPDPLIPHCKGSMTAVIEQT
jgi:ATP-dependent Clp protease adaptor protein ClpS